MGESADSGGLLRGVGRAGLHGTLLVGGRKTTDKDRNKEIRIGLLSNMLCELGIGEVDF